MRLFRDKKAIDSEPQRRTEFDKYPLDYALKSACQVVDELAGDVFQTTQKMRYASEQLVGLQNDIIGLRDDIRNCRKISDADCVGYFFEDA